jgi:hypothetical protein
MVVTNESPNDSSQANTGSSSLKTARQYPVLDKDRSEYFLQKTHQSARPDPDFPSTSNTRKHCHRTWKPHQEFPKHFVQILIQADAQNLRKLVKSYLPLEHSDVAARLHQSVRKIWADRLMTSTNQQLKRASPASLNCAFHSKPPCLQKTRKEFMIVSLTHALPMPLLLFTTRCSGTASRTIAKPHHQWNPHLEAFTFPRD